MIHLEITNSEIGSVKRFDAGTGPNVPSDIFIVLRKCVGGGRISEDVLPNYS